MTSPMWIRAAACLLVLLLAVGAASPAMAQTAAEADSGALTVAVYEAPPFAQESADGTWSGLGVELAQEVGGVLGRPVRFVAVPIGGAVAAVASGQADAALAPVTVDGELRADYTPSFYAARLGVARPLESRIATVAGNFFSGTFFWIAGALSVLLLLVGTAVWALERHENDDEFREDPKGGIWDGFWWAGVTMTTIGYGDKAPKTVPGRTLALLWMLVSMAVTAALTAGLVSALGLQTSGSGGGSGGVRLPEDLTGERVGVVTGSAAADVLREARVDARPFPNMEAGVRAVEADSLDTFAESAPRLRAALSGRSGLRVQTTGVEFERWAFAVAPGSPLREPLGRAVVERIHSPDWPSTVRRHVGTE